MHASLITECITAHSPTWYHFSGVLINIVRAVEYSRSQHSAVQAAALRPCPFAHESMNNRSTVRSSSSTMYAIRLGLTARDCPRVRGDRTYLQAARSFSGVPLDMLYTCVHVSSSASYIRPCPPKPCPATHSGNLLLQAETTELGSKSLQALTKATSRGIASCMRVCVWVSRKSNDVCCRRWPQLAEWFPAEHVHCSCARVAIVPGCHSEFTFTPSSWSQQTHPSHPSYIIQSQARMLLDSMNGNADAIRGQAQFRIALIISIPGGTYLNQGRPCIVSTMKIP